MKVANSSIRALATFGCNVVGWLPHSLASTAWWRHLKSRSPTAGSLLPFFFFISVTVVLFLSCFKATIFSRASQAIFSSSKPISFPLICTNLTQTCPKNDYPTNHTITNPHRSTCPSYFRWIHEDLRLWKDTGITREMVEREQKPANFRLVILNGKVYLEKYRAKLYSRELFTLWGILQLLRMYPGRVPNLDLIFNCEDKPMIRSRDFMPPRPPPPPLFKYCKDDQTLDIVFPDWSFWGWKEINIKPWRQVLNDIKEGNKRMKWKDRVPYAYWRGNPNVSPNRKDLLKCNVSDKHDWNSRLYIINWKEQINNGYKESNLEDQCTHRYKIYIEGIGWSVSEKYILSCDSMTLLVKPNFYDFFTRELVPLQHYWPIRPNTKCSALKFAVEWGNNNTDKAKAIGEAGSRYIYEDMKMGYIYDFMLHILTEYAKLLRYKPTVPPGAVELCPESMACNEIPMFKESMLETMVESPSDSVPCTLPPPYEPWELQALVKKKAQNTRKVEVWEDEYWKDRDKERN